MSCLKHGMQHIDTTQIWWFMMIQIWHKMKSKALDTMTWVDLSKQLLDSIGMTKHLELAPETQKTQITELLHAFINVICLFWLVQMLKPPQQKKHTQPGPCSLKKFVNKMLWLKVKNLREFQRRMTDTPLILDFWWWRTPPVFLPSNIFRIWRSWGSAQERSIALLKFWWKDCLIVSKNRICLFH